jgi:PAS domain S-box-containing protein
VVRRGNGVRLRDEVEHLRAELAECQELIAAIQSGSVDALVAVGGRNPPVAIADGADRPYRQFFESMDEGAVTVDPDGRILFGNRRFTELLGEPEMAVFGRSILDLVVSSTRSILEEAIARSEPTHRALEVRLRGESGREIPVAFTTSPLDLDGQQAVCLLFTDVSERRGFEDDLRFRSRLLDAVEEAIIVLQLDGEIVYANLAAERTFGCPRSEILGHVLDEMFPSSRTPEQSTERAAAIRSGRSWSGEYRIRRNDRSMFPAAVTETPLVDEGGTITASIVVTRDVTLQKAAEDEVKASERWYRALIQNSSDIVTVVSHDGTFSYISPSISNVLGFAPESLLGRPRERIVHPDDEKAVRSAYADAVVGRGPRRLPITYRARTASGSWRYLESELTNLLNDPVVNGIIANSRDVTEAHLAHAALRTSEGLLSEAQALAHVGHWRWEVEAGTVEWLAHEMHKIYGIDEQEWDGTHDAHLAAVHLEDREALRRALESCAAGAALDQSCRVVRPSGEVRHVRIHAHRLEQEVRTVVLGTTQDVSELAFSRIALEEMNEELRSANEEITTSLARLRASDEQRRQLLHEIVTAQEAERRRISADIHDDSIQVIAATKMRLDFLRRGGVEGALGAQLEEFSSLLGECLERLRSLVFQLIPASLERGGLEVALREIVESWPTDAPVGVSVESDGAYALSEDEQIILFRIGQEALANVRKHAAASSVQISLSSVAGGVRLVISDDGVGLRARDPDGQPHFGVATMAERAELAGGECHVRSTGVGTTVEAWIPTVQPA